MTSRISTSLCRIIFESPNTNDSLSFMTILSTGLKVLKQWGYNGCFSYRFYVSQVADLIVIHQLVDRILPQQKAERQATEVEREEAEKATREEVEKVGAERGASFISNLTEMTLPDAQTKIPITQTNIPLPPARTVMAAPVNVDLQRTSKDSKHSLVTSAISGIPELGRPLRQSHSEAALSQQVPPPPEGASKSANPGSLREIILSPPPDPFVTSHSDIGMPLEA